MTRWSPWNRKSNERPALFHDLTWVLVDATATFYTRRAWLCTKFTMKPTAKRSASQTFLLRNVAVFPITFLVTCFFFGFFQKLLKFKILPFSWCNDPILQYQFWNLRQWSRIWIQKRDQWPMRLFIAMWTLDVCCQEDASGFYKVRAFSS